MLGNMIITTPEPRGRRFGAVISGNLLPGICVQIKAATEPDAGGNFTWEPYDKSGSGAPGLFGILDYDKQQGKTYLDAYVSGKHGFIYIPQPGETFNMLVADIAGTGATSDYAIGDLLMPQDGTGKLVDALLGTAQYTIRPFAVLETYNDMVADTLLHVMFNGF